MSLNQRQELFCQNMILGKSATESAKLAGYSERTAYSMGPRLLKSVVVCQRIAALQTAVVTGNIATVIRRKEILTNIANDKHKEPLTARERVYAISELNKMGGDYAPEKHAVIQDVTIRFIIGKGYEDAIEQEEE